MKVLKRIAMPAIALALALTAASCGGLIPVVGDGTLGDTVRHSGESFTAIESSGIFKINIVPATKDSSVVITTDGNIARYVETNVLNGTLYIDEAPFMWLMPSIKSVITVYAPSVTGIMASGIGDVSCLGYDVAGTMTVDASGTGDVNLSGSSSALKLIASGTGDLNLEGSCSTLDVDASGTGDLDSTNLMADDVSVTMSGTGDCDVYAAKTLYVNLSGVGDLRYTGSAIATINKTGLGTVTAY